jgi:hypothetical protein
MKVKTTNRTQLSSLFAKYLRLSDREIAQVSRDYLLNNPHDEELLSALSKSYLRSSSNFIPSDFHKVEWLIAVLFFGLGLNINKIAEIVNQPRSQVKIYFFSAKENLLRMERKCQTVT